MTNSHKRILFFYCIMLHLMILVLGVREYQLRNYDYHIELEQVHIDILDECGNYHRIDPDSLQEFIIMDNL